MGAARKETQAAAKFAVWLSDAPKGNIYEYHRGFLGRDRDGSGPVGRVADAAYDASGRGEVLLTQERHGEMDYSYLAQRA